MVKEKEYFAFISYQRKDEAFSERGCLVNWEELASDKISGYDYEVVDRSFRLADEEYEKMRAK